MTAAELASFRSLLQAQAPPPPRPDRGLFARMRARLTVVEGTEPPGETPPARPAFARPRLATVSWEEPDAPVADPLPGTPPVFGRREAGPDTDAAPRPMSSPSADAARIERVAVRPRVASPADEAHGTPDELPPGRSARLAARPTTTGTIGGWSRARPAGAQRRILQRLEAVFTAELQGLDARIAADAPAR